MISILKPRALPAGQGIQKKPSQETHAPSLWKVLTIGPALHVFLALFSVAHALEVPPLRGRVNDYASLMAADRTRLLEERLAQFERDSGHQVAVLTIPSLEGDNLEGFSIRVVEKWKIGQKGLDNGAVLLIARDERKIRIEVGYGLEGILPDAIASQIIREIIAPGSRDGDYAGAIEAGIDAILKVTSGEALPITARPKPPQQRTDPFATLGLLAMTALLSSIVGISQQTSFRGAVFGGTAGGIVSFFGAAATGMAVWVAALFIGSFVGALASFYARRAWGRAWTVRAPRREKVWIRDVLTDTSGSSGGFSDGDSWNGGFGDDFGGGGFSAGSGFSGGGGDFGGGGASGDG